MISLGALFCVRLSLPVLPARQAAQLFDLTPPAISRSSLRQLDLQLASGEYFLSRAARAQKEREEIDASRSAKAALREAERAKAFKAPRVRAIFFFFFFFFFFFCCCCWFL